MSLPIVSPMPFDRAGLMQFVRIDSPLRGLPGATNKISGAFFQGADAVDAAVASVLDTIQRIPQASYQSRLVDLQNVWSSLQ